MPEVPPLSVNAVSVPGHTVKDGLPLTEVGMVDIVFVVTVTI